MDCVTFFKFSTRAKGRCANHCEMDCVTSLNSQPGPKARDPLAQPNGLGMRSPTVRAPKGCDIWDVVPVTTIAKDWTVTL